MAFWHSYQYVEHDKRVYTLLAPNKQVYNALIVKFILQCLGYIEQGKRHVIPSFSSPLSSKDTAGGVGKQRGWKTTRRRNVGVQSKTP